MPDKQPVSPINGQPLPRGKPFTSETAREARRKRMEKEAQKASITKAFIALMNKEFVDGSGNTRNGAEIIAESILSGATKGIPKMVEIALDITGEKPALKVTTDDNGKLADLIDGLVSANGIHTETTGIDEAMADGEIEEN